MKAIIDSNCHKTVRQIAKRLNLSHTIIENNIERTRLGLFMKQNIDVPEELKEIHSTQRINICDADYECNPIYLFYSKLSLVMKNTSFTK